MHMHVLGPITCCSFSMFNFSLLELRMHNSNYKARKAMINSLQGWLMIFCTEWCFHKVSHYKLFFFCNCLTEESWFPIAVFQAVPWYFSRKWVSNKNRVNWKCVSNKKRLNWKRTKCSNVWKKTNHLKEYKQLSIKVMFPSNYLL